ncbi:MAG: calcium/sodium antiporter [Lachnospiraceae bacterium]|nr:calcium/sodium antiporter [Lachnospiraceae bacterium]
MEYLLLLVGFVLLIKGADFFVEGSSSIAKALKIPSIVIGLTLVSMGTSAPEAAVSITAAFSGSSDISLGNVIGSNIFNLLTVIGCAAIIRPIDSPKEIVKRDLWWNLGITGLLFLMIFDKNISRLNGLILLAGMMIYLFIVVKKAMENRLEETSVEVMPIPKSIVFVVLGLGAVIIGGQLVVNNASIIARSLGMSDALVGLTIVAIGTSLPELVTSVMAARKGEPGIALGNAVGSCLFNLMFILGSTSVLTPIHVASDLLVDTIILIAVSLIVTIFVITGQKTKRWEGMACLTCYVVYTAFIILR